MDERHNLPQNSSHRAVLSIAGVALIMALSLALGWHGLASRPLSEDEAASRAFALYPHGYDVFADGGNMALYYYVLHLVLVKISPSILAMRLLSVLCGVATVPLVFAIGRRLVSRRCGMFAAALFAISLPVVFWQQSARGYALGVLLVTASTFAFLLMMDSTRWIPQLAYIVLSVLACYTLLLASLVLAAQVASLLACRRAEVPLARVLLSASLIAVACLPLMLVAAHKGTTQIDWVLRPGFASLRTTGLSLMSAASANGPATHSTFAAFMGYASLVVCLGLVGLTVARAVRRQPDANRFVVSLLGLWLFAPPIMAFALSQIGAHVYLDRYFTICLPAAALLLAVALDRIAHPVAAGLAVVTLLGLRTSTLGGTYGEPIDQAWLGAAHALAYSARPGDCVTFDVPQGVLTTVATSNIAYFDVHDERQLPLPTPMLPRFSWTQADRPGFLAPAPNQSFSSVKEACRRLWIVQAPGIPGFATTLGASEIAWFSNHAWRTAGLEPVGGISLIVMQPRRLT